jgi:hypothetical protein
MNKNVKKSELTIASLESRSRQITRKATGPRTAAGKERSKRNAVKHGILSRAVLLPNESRSEFDALLRRLWKNHQPEGDEELLVEKLATLWWRYHRLLIAEAAEIQKGTAFLEWDEQDQLERDAQESPHNNSLDVFADEVGLTRKLANFRILERCLTLLDRLWFEFERYGFDSESNEIILTKLYGSSDHCVATLFDTYRAYKNVAKCSEGMSEGDKCERVEQWKSFFLSELQKEIHRLNQYKKASAPILAERLRLESLRLNVPDSPHLDRLLKYEASLERAIDRTLAQLERFQRMRLGQSVTPPIKLDISAS